MEDTRNNVAPEEQDIDDPDKTDDEQDKNDVSLLEENEEQIEAGIDQEDDESALLDHEADDQMEHNPNDSSHLEENGDLGDPINDSQNKKLNPDDEVADIDADENAAAAKEQTKSEAGDEGHDDEDDAEEEEAKNRDINEMPQVNVATLAKRKWQVKVYPLKPEDFVSGQISRVFSNARESLLYILSSGRYSGGKGEMYVSSGGQAARVVQNLMKLDFKSPNINIEIIKKNDEGAIEEKAFLRFDAKLVRILCVPALPNRRMGIKRERVIGSVFVKNLPKGTSKDMLRVMFPFAPEINFNPEKFQDGTARLVLSTRSAVAPCLRAFAKVELGDSLLELRPLQRRTKSTDDAKQTSSKKSKSGNEKSDLESSKTEEGKEESGKSETEDKSSDTKKEEKESSKLDSSTQEQNKSSKKSPSTSKSADAKKGQADDQKPKSTSHRSHSVGSNSHNRKSRDKSGNRRWTDRRGDSGLRNARNRFRGGNLGQKGDNRNRFRTGGGFGMRNRSDDRRMRTGLQGASGNGNINTTETTKEMIILQSQLSMAIKNQLSMLNQTQLALEQAKRGAVGLSIPREAQATSSGLMGNRVSDQYSMNQLQPENTRRGQMKGGNRRYQQARRGNNRARDKRQGEGHLVSLAGGDYGYNKRSANLAGLQQDYAAAGFGKRRNTGMAARSESQSWAEDPSAFGHQAHYGYDHELDDRDTEFRSMQAGSMSQSYGHSNYGYRY